MEISELLRRGNFSKSKLFLSSLSQFSNEGSTALRDGSTGHSNKQSSYHLGQNSHKYQDSQNSMLTTKEFPQFFPKTESCRKIVNQNKHQHHQSSDFGNWEDFGSQEKAKLKDGFYSISSTTHHSKKPSNSSSQTDFFQERKINYNGTLNPLYPRHKKTSSNGELFNKQSEHQIWDHHQKQSISSYSISQNQLQSSDSLRRINISQINEPKDSLFNTAQCWRGNSKEKDVLEDINFKNQHKNYSKLYSKNIINDIFNNEAATKDPMKIIPSSFSKSFQIAGKDSSKNFSLDDNYQQKEVAEKLPARKKESEIPEKVKQVPKPLVKQNKNKNFLELKNKNFHHKTENQNIHQEGKRDFRQNRSPEKKGFRFSTIMGLIKMKKKVNTILRGNDSFAIEEDNNLNSYKGGNFTKEKPFYENHFKVVNDLKKEEGEIHDIYGTFHDKIKQIQVQIKDTLSHYSLAQIILEQVIKEKKQSKVIDVVENTINTICLALEHLEQISDHLGEKEELDKILAQQAIQIMKFSSANFIIQIETVMIYAKYCQELSNYGKALRLFKQCKNMSTTLITLRYRMISYMSIGQCYQNLKIYPTALLYFGKCLEYTWYLDDKEVELNAYDMLGVTHYLQGDLESAKFYHEKMIHNDNEPKESDIRNLSIKKLVEKLKKINSEEYAQKLSMIYKKFFAKIHSVDYEEEYECSSSEDEFEVSLPKTSSQKNNREYEEYLQGQSPRQKRHAEAEKKRYIAIFNSEDRVAQQNIRQQANQNIRIQEYRRIALSLPVSIKKSSAQSYKPVQQTQKAPFCINQFTINRNLENYLIADSRYIKSNTYDFFKQVEDTNDKKLRYKIIYMLSQFQNNLIFALSQIHCMREREKYSSITHRRIGFSGLSNFINVNQISITNSINIPQQIPLDTIEESQCIQSNEDIDKYTSNKSYFKGGLDQSHLPI